MAEQDTSPAEQDSSPAEQGSSPAEQGSSPAEQGSSPAEQDSSQVIVGPDGDERTSEAADGGEVGVSDDVESAPATTTPAHATPASMASLLEREGEVAADFLEQLLDIADMDGDIDVDVDGDRAAVAIVDSEEGRVSRRLVGTDGKVLEALQELTRLAVQASTGERSRLMLDVAGFRAERRAAVMAIARAAIDTVKSTNEKVPMDPMTAFERKVVHDEVLAAGLRSESDGVEPQRHVVILPA